MAFAAVPRRRPLGGLIDRFLFDTLPAPRRTVPPVPAAAHSFVRPRETALDLLAGASYGTLASVAHALEFRRLQYPAGSRTINSVLADIRPLLRGLRPIRLPSLSRLVWTPIQALLTDGIDREDQRGDSAATRPWTTSRLWLTPLWRFMLERSGVRLNALSARLERILATIGPKEAGGSAAQALLRSEPVAAIALEAQGEALHCLNDLAGDHAMAEAFAASLAAAGDLPPDLCQADRITRIAGRLATLMAVAVEHRDPFLSLTMGIDGRLAGPGPSWRDDREFIYDLQKDLERTLKTIGASARGEAGVQQAAAFLIMLARSLASPWPLVAAVRRLTLQREGAGGRAYDSFAPPEVVALMEHMVSEAERLGTRAVDALQFEASQFEADDANTDDVFEALTRTMAAGSWLHGLLSSGFLETNGVRHRRVLSVRAALSPLATNRLLPTLRTLILHPFIGDWAEQPKAGAGNLHGDHWSDRIAAAENAARQLHTFTAGADGLRCHGLAHQILKDMETALTHIFEKMLPRQRAEHTDIAARMNALIRVTEVIRPGLGDSFTRRVLNRIKPPAPTNHSSGAAAS